MSREPLPNRRLNTVLRRLTRALLRESREELARYAVVSGIDEEIYVFADRDEALEFAESADGSTFQWSVTEI
jgi:hypothetical protein